VNPAPAGAEPPPQKNGRRKTVLLVIGVVLLIGALVWLFHWWTVGRFIESTDDAYLRADSVTIAPKVSGYVTQVYVTDNQAVKAGQPLVKLDARQYEASVAQARASLDSKRADIVRAQANIRQQEASIEQAKAQAAAARINADHAAHEYARFEPLAATGAETTEKLADLRSTRDQAQANYQADLAAAKSATAQIATIKAQVQQAQAELESTQASGKKSTLDLDDTVVYSAIDGRVGDKTVRVGQFVQPGTAMMTVVPVQYVYLVANFKETQVGDMRIGQSASLHIDAMPGQDLKGVVDSFSPGTGSEFALLPPENATGNFTKIVQRVPVKIRIIADADTRSVLLPGMSVTVDVDTLTKGQAAPSQQSDASGQSASSAAPSPSPQTSLASSSPAMAASTPPSAAPVAAPDAASASASSPAGQTHG
jgi:membrane fusion protein (multidrug efflux system)